MAAIGNRRNTRDHSRTLTQTQTSAGNGYGRALMN